MGTFLSLISGLVTPLFGLLIIKIMTEMQSASYQGDNVLEAIKMPILYIVFATLAIFLLKGISMIFFAKVGH